MIILSFVLLVELGCINLISGRAQNTPKKWGYLQQLQGNIYTKPNKGGGRQNLHGAVPIVGGTSLE